MGDGEPHQLFSDWPNEVTGRVAQMVMQYPEVLTLAEAKEDEPGYDAVPRLGEELRQWFFRRLDLAAPENEIGAAELRKAVAEVDWISVAEHIWAYCQMHAEVSRTLSGLRERLPESRRCVPGSVALGFCRNGDGAALEAVIKGTEIRCCPLCGAKLKEDAIGMAVIGEPSDAPVLHIPICSGCRRVVVPPGAISTGTH